MKKYLSRIWSNRASYIGLVFWGFALMLIIFLITDYWGCIKNSYVENIIVGTTSSIIASMVFLIVDTYRNFNQICENAIYKIMSLLVSVDFFSKMNDTNEDILVSDCVLKKQVFYKTYKYLCRLNSMNTRQRHFVEISDELYKIIMMLDDSHEQTTSVKSILATVNDKSEKL